MLTIAYTGAHRALPDILAMERMITHPSLVHCLSDLPIRSPSLQKDLWTQQKLIFSRTTALVKSLGKPSITSAQAKRLDELGFSYADLSRLKSQSKTRQVFLDSLKTTGVNSKPLREKLANHFKFKLQ